MDRSPSKFFRSLQTKSQHCFSPFKHDTALSFLNASLEFTNTTRTQAFQSSVEDEGSAPVRKLKRTISSVVHTLFLLDFVLLYLTHTHTQARTRVSCAFNRLLGKPATVKQTQRRLRLANVRAFIPLEVFLKLVWLRHPHKHPCSRTLASMQLLGMAVPRLRA